MISQDAKDLVKGLLALLPADRITADEALKSPWLVREDLSDEPLNLNLEGFKNKRTSSMALPDVRDMADHDGNEKEVANVFRMGGIMPRRKEVSSSDMQGSSVTAEENV